MKRPVKVTLCLLVVPFLILFVFCCTRYYKVSHYPKWFTSVTIGDTKEMVVQTGISIRHPKQAELALDHGAKRRKRVHVWTLTAA